ncbi:hypothetical protein LXL04_039579 [Taraxacum kok-saghyz]
MHSPLPTAWETGRQDWYVGGPSHTQTGDSPRSSQHSTTGGDPTMFVIACIAECLAQVETEIAAITQEWNNIIARAQVMDTRVRILEQGKERDEVTIATIRAELADALDRLASLRDRMDLP